MDPLPTKLNSIKNWSSDDRPREKMLSKGRHSLTDSELLGIILGSGSIGESAVELSKRILNDHHNNLNELGKISIRDLIKKYKGIGEAKAINIIAALELGRRRQESNPLERSVIKSSRDAFNILYPIIADLPHEEFWVLFCNRANKVIHKQSVGRGGISSVVADAKIIMRIAVEHLASSLILCHNHPSGNLKPSSEDIKLTQKVKEAANILDLSVNDHIIIGDNNYFSFADEGIL
ncbi:MAG: DNA repair protein RadC [Saprospiraceae bacterium]|jgi:DNA repair protein RadC|nr:DNA repair protein RadC [Saprospiraceae bacterium]MBL0026264.1 DNA repair protein RadC [Saprospiraceae bacterium]